MNVNGQSGTPKRSIPMVVLHCYEIGYQIKSRAARLPISNGGAALLRDRISNQISCRPLAHLHVWSSAVLQTLA